MLSFATMKYLLVGSLLLLCGIWSVKAARILAFFPFPMKSHQIVFLPLLKGLAERGHDITFVTPFPVKEPALNASKSIIVQFQFDEKSNQSIDDPYEYRHFTGIGALMFHWRFGPTMCDAILKSPNIQELIKDKDQHFDVILTEVLFAQEPFIALGKIFKAPVIDFSSNCGTHYVHDVLNNPTIFSYITDYRTQSSDRMTLFERLKNLVYGLLEIYGTYWYYLPRIEKLVQEAFNFSEADASLLKEMLKNVSLSFINTDPVLGYPRPQMPHVIDVAGISLQSKTSLSQGLQKIMDDAKDGVIYFSFGSILRGENMAVAQRKHFIEAFRRLNQTVLWKYEAELEGPVPPNIHTRKWFPQGGVLAHPNCKVFIMHGGYLSLVDTVDAGVPVIVVPFFADQYRNAHMAETKGFGIHLTFDLLTPDLIVDSIQKVLSDQSYSDNAKKLSSVFRDRIVSPVDKAVYWTEYVIRHKGNPLSQTGAKDLWWFQYFLLDIVVIVLFIIFSLFFVLYKFCKFTVNRIFPQKSKSKKHTKHKDSKKKTK